jgi:hypothetical protein
MVPFWQSEWAMVSYDSLFAAGSQIEEALEALYDIKYSTHVRGKMASYQKQREELMRLGTLFVHATNTRDTTKAMELLPRLREAYEATAAALLPVPFPGYDEFRSRVNVLVGNELNAIAAPQLQIITDSIKLMADSLPADKVPAGISELAEMVVQEFAYFSKLAGRMQEALRDGPRNKYDLLAKELGARVNTFSRMYLE